VTRCGPPSWRPGYAMRDGKYDTIFPDGLLTFDTVTFDTSFHS
jgi:hypothetical protein